MVSQRSRTAKASHTPPRCHSERTVSFRAVSFRAHIVSFRGHMCHSEGSEESKYLAPGLTSQILRCAQNDVDGQNDVAGRTTWMAVGCFMGVDG